MIALAIVSAIVLGLIGGWIIGVLFLRGPSQPTYFEEAEKLRQAVDELGRNLGERLAVPMEAMVRAARDWKEP
jgi:hypothetical protein